MPYLYGTIVLFAINLHNTVMVPVQRPACKLKNHGIPVKHLEVYM
jgi:hypothetical protein